MRVPNFLFNDWASIKRLKGHSAYGKVFEDPVMSKCRIEPEQRLIYDKDGNKYTSRARAFFPHGTSNIPPESEIKWDGMTYEVISAIPAKGLKSISHLEVLMR